MIGFVGLSHLGIVSSIATAAKGFDVLAFDPNSTLCDDLNRGQLPVLEPDLPELLANNQSRISFTADPTKLSQCDPIYFSVDVATDADNRSDLGMLKQLIETVIPNTAPGTILVILSQVNPGFTRQQALELAEKYRDRGLQLFYQVETLIFGRAVERALYPERFIVGCGDPSVPLPEVYAQLLGAFDCPILPMRYESAELAKISINMCLVASISAANTLAEICEEIGADWAEIVPALRLDKRIGQYSYIVPGLGIAGGNLERDLMTVTALAKEHGTDAGVVEAWLVNSRYRKDWVLRTLHRTAIASCSNPAIALWGLAYKPNTHSIKNAPSLTLLESLKPFKVKAYDPQVILDRDDLAVEQVKTALEACQDADVLVVMTPWSEFSEVDLDEVRSRMKGRIIIDPFAALNGQNCTDLGFSYYRLGVPPVLGKSD